MSSLSYSLKVASISCRTWDSSVSDAAMANALAPACLSSAARASTSLCVCAQIASTAPAPLCERFGDGLPDLSVVAHAHHQGDFAFKTGRHVIQSDVARTIDVSSIRLAILSLVIHPTEASARGYGLLQLSGVPSHLLGLN
jgi:hypothetical protein